jgi:hypothetical protein
MTTPAQGKMACGTLNHNTTTTQGHAMHTITQAAYQTLDEVWGAIYCDKRRERAYRASLWLMAGHVCTAFALQHATAQLHDDAMTFGWLAAVCDTRMHMAGEPQEPRIAGADPIKLAVVSSLPRAH